MLSVRPTRSCISTASSFDNSKAGPISQSDRFLGRIGKLSPGLDSRTLHTRFLLDLCVKLREGLRQSKIRHTEKADVLWIAGRNIRGLLCEMPECSNFDTVSDKICF